MNNNLWLGTSTIGIKLLRSLFVVALVMIVSVTQAEEKKPPRQIGGETEVGISTVGGNCQLTTPPVPTVIVEGGVKKVRGIGHMKCKTDTYVNQFYSRVTAGSTQLAESIIYQNFTARAGVTYYAEAKNPCYNVGNTQFYAYTYVRENTATDVNYNTSASVILDCVFQ